MDVIHVKKVFGKAYIGNEIVDELIIPIPVNIYSCPKCEHAIIEDEKIQSTIVTPEEPKIIIAQ